jgi:hypothetical protein
MLGGAEPGRGSRSLRPRRPPCPAALMAKDQGADAVAGELDSYPDGPGATARPLSVPRSTSPRPTGFRGLHGLRKAVQRPAEALGEGLEGSARRPSTPSRGSGPSLLWTYSVRWSTLTIMETHCPIVGNPPSCASWNDPESGVFALVPCPPPSKSPKALSLSLIQFKGLRSCGKRFATNWNTERIFSTSHTVVTVICQKSHRHLPETHRLLPHNPPSCA